jgi:hypothetical protein
MKIRTVGAEFHADEQTDMTKLIVTFHNFADASNMLQVGCSFFIALYSGFGGIGVACWSLVPKFTGSSPADAVGCLRTKKPSARLPSEGK